LPFDAFSCETDTIKSAFICLLNTVCNVFELLEIDTRSLISHQSAIIISIVSDPTMFEENVVATHPILHKVDLDRR
jgi:hypothetical protein